MVGACLKNIRKEVLELITVNEKIQSGVLIGRVLTEEEMEVLRFCVQELLRISDQLPQTATPSGMNSRHTKEHVSQQR